MKSTNFSGNGQTLENSNLLNTKERIYYLDYLKLFLITLVISHHSMEAYLDNSEWAYRDASSAKWLYKLHYLNASFFMGLFFFISGYFVVNSIKKRSAKDFILMKARYLLLPVVFIGVVLVPLEFYVAGYGMNKIKGSFFDYYINTYLGEGKATYEHGWYLVSLFLFSVLYLIIRNIIGEKNLKKVGKLTFGKVCIVTMIIVVCTFIMHRIYDFDEWITILGFIGAEPVHYLQYIILFITGAVAGENNWANELTDKIGSLAAKLGLAMTGVMFIREYIIPNSLYFLVESLACMSICIGLLFVFKKYFYVENKFFVKLSKCNFKVYVWHILFVIIFQVWMGSYELSATVKYLIVTILATITTYLFVYLKEL